jgi:hypothetical protein
MGANSGEPLTAVLTVITEKRDLAARRAIYLQRQAAVATAQLTGFNRVSASGATLWSDRIDFSAEGTYVVVCGDEFSAVFAGMFVTWHPIFLLSSIFHCRICF